jgi:hypothetical protein
MSAFGQGGHPLLHRASLRPSPSRYRAVVPIQCSNSVRQGIEPPLGRPPTSAFDSDGSSMYLKISRRLADVPTSLPGTQL